MAPGTPIDLVMVIDDDAIDNFIAKSVVELTGFARRTLVMSNASEALRYLTLNQMQTGHLPEIIFLDVHMPVMDGFEFMERFASLSTVITSKCKIILLSSSDYGQDMKRIIGNELVTKFITKPISEQALEEIHFATTHPVSEALIE